MSEIDDEHEAADKQAGYEPGSGDPTNSASFAPVQEPPGHWLNRGILGVGAASFFSDSGHEFVTSLLPSFLSSTLHSGPAVLGAIEGVSDALLGLSKLAGGPLSNDPSRRAKTASGGYLLTAVATSLIGLSTAVWQVAGLRALAWASRGVRSPARDTLLVSMTPRAAYGRAAGIERAGDNAGAIVGPLLAATLVGLLGIRTTIGLSLIPGLIAAVAIIVTARHARNVLATPVGKRTMGFNLGELRRAGLRRTLLPVSLFELGNLAAMLLILRATTILEAGGRGADTAVTMVILMYACHNAVASATALVGGQLIDRVNPRLVFTLGAGLYVAAYLLFAMDGTHPALLLAGFLLAGAGTGFAETSEQAAVALLLPDRLRGSGYGLLGLVQSFGDLGATVVAGVVWAVFSPTAAFLYAAAWMVAAVISSPDLRTRATVDALR
ncbi:MFS transporter [Paeniglutamicibacter antarcticus]|uniref:MFS transporter n=1 Tax=Paeniglutamicibacter antarcticus TaxID=494023 RepID=A0ABP9TK98_9MICC